MYFQFLFSFMSVSERGKHKKWSARYKYKYSKRFVDGWWPNRVWNKYVIESRMQRIIQCNGVRKQLFGIWFVYYTQSVAAAAAAAWNTLSILKCFACAHLILLLLFLVPISCLRSLSSRHAYNAACICVRSSVYDCVRMTSSLQKLDFKMLLQTASTPCSHLNVLTILCI